MRLYTQGSLDFLTVLVAERSLYRTHPPWPKANKRSPRTLSALYEALGGGWMTTEKDTESKRDYEEHSVHNGQADGSRRVCPGICRRFFFMDLNVSICNQKLINHSF